MTPARLAEIIAAFGAETARWPAAERAAALALAARSPEAAALLAEAAAVDAALGLTRPRPEAERLAALRRRIAGEIARRPLPAARRLGLLERVAWLEPFAPAGVGALAVLVAGFAWLFWNDMDQELVMLGPQALSLMGSLL